MTHLQNMKAVDVLRPGSPEVLRIIKCPIPTPGDQEILTQKKTDSIPRASKTSYTRSKSTFKITPRQERALRNLHEAPSVL